MTLVLLLHAALALAAPFIGRKLGPRVLTVCALPLVAALVWLAANAGTVLDGGTVTERWEWVPSLGLAVDLRLDGLSLLMASVIAGIGVAVFVYGRWYFADKQHVGGFAAALTAFAGSMLGVVLADNLLLLYVFWELTSVTSYLLIGTEHHKGSARSAALKALLITGAGGLAMLAGFVVVAEAAGTYSLSGVLADPPGGLATSIGVGLILLGAFTKSAQVPFHTWLPGAMAAPTPVSAYLHSATMVKAGVYLVARLAPVFAGVVWYWRPLVLAVGLATMLVGGYRALRETDLKLLLAYGTVSQLGLMVVLVGAGEPDLTFAGAALILAHSLFKGALFMVVGIVDHAVHTRDLRRLDGLGRQMPLVFATAAIAAASMAGLPLFVGFLAKEAVYEALLHSGGAVATVGVVLGSALTFAYGARFVWGAFARKALPSGSRGAAAASDAGASDPVVTAATPPPLPFVLPALVLTVLTVLLGIAPSLSDQLVRTAAAAAVIEPSDLPHLALWHGFSTALALSVVTVAIGVALFLKRRGVERLQARLAGPRRSPPPYERGVMLLNTVADRTTGFMQPGSLPIYAGVILLTAVALPGWWLVSDGRLPSTLVVAESPLQVVVAVAVLVAAIGCALSRRRFVAVMMLGAVGFGVAVLFVLQGAPDLALTQFLIETLAIVIFVLVLRHLPDHFQQRPSRFGTGLRVVVAGSVGVFVTVFALMAAGSRRHPTIADDLVARALPEGGGRNVVNVILTDFRAFDTLGEITVLTIAALGIASLVLVGRRGANAKGEIE